METDLMIVISQLGLAGICGGLVQALKQAGLKSTYAPIASAGIGLALGLVAAYLSPDVDLLVGIFGGLMSGLGMSGGYSGVKKIVKA